MTLRSQNDNNAENQICGNSTSSSTIDTLKDNCNKDNSVEQTVVQTKSDSYSLSEKLKVLNDSGKSSTEILSDTQKKIPRDAQEKSHENIPSNNCKINDSVDFVSNKISMTPEVLKNEKQIVSSRPHILRSNSNSMYDDVEQSVIPGYEDSNIEEKDSSVDWVEQDKEQRFAEQSERRELLFRQKQLIAICSEKDAKNLERCSQRYKAMLQRSETARITAEELNKFLSDRMKASDVFAESMKATKTSFGSRETGTFRQAAVAQDHLRTNDSEQYREMNERVFVSAVEKSAIYSKELKQQNIKHISDGSKITKSIQDAKSSLDQTWKNYEKVMADSLHLASQGKSLPTDPFLSGRLYDQAALIYSQRQGVYSKEMGKLFSDVKINDGHRIDEMKAILLDWFLAEKIVAEHRVKLLQSSISYIKAIDREKDVNDFIQTEGFIQSDKGDTVFDLLPCGDGAHQVSQLIQKEIIKTGKLMRQGRLITSNWKPTQAIITRGGFFHGFDSAQGLKPYISIVLAKVYVSFKPGLEDFVFEIAIPNKGFFSVTGNPTRHYFKAESDEEMVEWINAIKKQIMISR